MRCFGKTTRAVCIREVQNSIKDSVKQLLTDKIVKLGLGSSFEILETEIRGPHGSLIVFKGMQSYNADNIKSLEGYDIAWVEEAQTLSQHSLDLLRPTLRNAGSELWFSWNPRHKTDPVDMFFRKNPPENAISVMINWRDNPWFPKELRDEMKHDFLVDEDKANHIWNGFYGSGQGAIIAKLVNQAERDGRINDDVVFDPKGSPIVVSSDIGFRDTAAWWYWQPLLGGYNLLKYEGDTGMDAEDWIPRIQDSVRGLGAKSVGMIWLPQDARAKTFQSKHTTMEKFIGAFTAQKVNVVPPTKKLDQISASRSVITKCAFNKTECEAGLDGLLAWEFEYNEDSGVFSREPRHDWASHPADAFSYGSIVMQMDKPTQADKPPTFPVEAKNGRIVTAPLDDLWNEKTARRGER